MIMNGNNVLIGVGGNIHSPNPRLPAYILPAVELANNNIQDNIDLILVSSLSGVLLGENSENREKIEFNTNKKIEFLVKFIEYFYPSVFNNLQIDYGEKQILDNYNDLLEIWILIEKNFSDDESRVVNNILNNFSKNNDISLAKKYAIAHAFWFKDFTFSESYQDKILKSIGGHQEEFFNFIRQKVSDIGVLDLSNLFGENLIQNNVERIIVPTGGVSPYGEATRKSGKKKISIEYPIFGDDKINISEFYNSAHAIKSGINRDIEYILSNVVESDYQDFWNDFQKSYKIDLLNN